MKDQRPAAALHNSCLCTEDWYLNVFHAISPKSDQQNHDKHLDAWDDVEVWRWYGGCEQRRIFCDLDLLVVAGADSVMGLVLR